MIWTCPQGSGLLPGAFLLSPTLGLPSAMSCPSLEGAVPGAVPRPGQAVASAPGSIWSARQAHKAGVLLLGSGPFL